VGDQLRDGHIFVNVVPMMRRRGFSEAEIQAIVIDNPRRLLTGS
jgi:phosphotriesterase-related protein